MSGTWGTCRAWRSSWRRRKCVGTGAARATVGSTGRQRKAVPQQSSTWNPSRPPPPAGPPPRTSVGYPWPGTVAVTAGYSLQYRLISS